MQRYNRVIDRAVIDVVSKKSIVTGTTDLRNLEVQANDLEKWLRESHSDIMDSIRLTATDETINSLIIHEAVPLIPRDRRIALGGRTVHIKADCIVLEDRLTIKGVCKFTASPDRAFKFPGLSPEAFTKSFLQTCRTFITDCNTSSLPKLAVEGSLYFARVARFQRSSTPDDGYDKKKTDHIQEARVLLENALDLCKQAFQNVEQLQLESIVNYCGREGMKKSHPRS